MKIEHPEKFSIDELDNLFLWKYLDLFKLIDLLTTKDLYFTRFDNFEDGLEGLTGKAIGLMAFTQGRRLTKENINKELPNEQQEQAIRNDRQYRLDLQEQINLQKSQYACCWFLDDRESLAMWKIYSKQEGIALKFKAKQLTETIIASAQSYTNSDFHILYYGKVDYKNIWPFDPHENFDGKFNGLKKDRSYMSENEFRFVTVVPKIKAGVHHHFKLPIGSLKDFDLQIISTPFMDDWQFDCLNYMLKHYGLDDKLIRSKMKIKK